jgi:hypothetical protein
MTSLMTQMTMTMMMTIALYSRLQNTTTPKRQRRQRDSQPEMLNVWEHFLIVDIRMAPREATTAPLDNRGGTSNYCWCRRRQKDLCSGVSRQRRPSP